MTRKNLIKLILLLPFWGVNFAFSQDSNAPAIPHIEIQPMVKTETFVHTEQDGKFTRYQWSGAFELKQEAGRVSLSGKFTLPSIPSVRLPLLLWVEEDASQLAPQEDVHLSCRSRTWGEWTPQNTQIRVTEHGGRLALVVDQLPAESQPVTVYFEGESWEVGE
ncbi:MAG: hypothetical protein H6581_10495 [Bacteroidia bacterium]|nr:hypothetical protein [Bacteroidia bacterium]